MFVALLLATALAMFGAAAPALAIDDSPNADAAEASDDGEDKKSKKKSDKKSKSKKSSDKKSSDKKKSDAKKSDSKKSEQDAESDKKSTSKKKANKSKKSKKKADDEAKAVLLADIAVAEYKEWIEDGVATKKDNDVVSIRHAISCGDKLIRDLLKQGVKVAELDEDERDDAEFEWRYEEICDPPEKKKKSSGTSKTKKKTKKKVSTADKLRQAEKARIQIEEWIADGVFDKDDPAIEAVLFTLDCADAMIEYTLDAGRDAVEEGTVGVREVIHAHEDICESRR